jgi:hypothetical protein
MIKTAQQEGVILIFEDTEPSVLVRKNGAVRYYKLVEMGFQDHVELLGADIIIKKREKNNS